MKYSNVVRENLERMETHELKRRFLEGALTEEARLMASSILAERGVASSELAPPIPSKEAQLDSQSSGIAEKSIFLGLGILACIIGFSTLFNGTASLEFGFGYALAQMFGSSLLALPPFLIWRFYTISGAKHSLGGAFNAYSFMVLAAWLLIVLSRLFLIRT